MEERIDKRKGWERKRAKKRERRPVRVFEMGSHESKRREGGERGREGGVGEELRGLSVQKGSQEPALKPTV